MSALSSLLDTYRSASVTEREKGTYFEELICAYLRNEATYRYLYSDVFEGFDQRERLLGIDGVTHLRLAVDDRGDGTVFFDDDCHACLADVVG